MSLLIVLIFPPKKVQNFVKKVQDFVKKFRISWDNPSGHAHSRKNGNAYSPHQPVRGRPFLVRALQPQCFLSKHTNPKKRKRKKQSPTQSEGAVFRLVHGACWWRKNAPPWLGLVGGEFWAVNQKTAVPRSLTPAPTKKTTRISSWRRRDTSKLYTKRRRVTHRHEDLWAAHEGKEKESWWVGRGAGGRDAVSGSDVRAPVCDRRFRTVATKC